MDDYETMLREGREDLPEEVFEGARFEIPEAETDKRGNRTVITNFGAIADTLNRDPEHLATFLFGELGTAGHRDGKELVLKGSFRRGSINSKIEQYCDEYVICQECNKPDTAIRNEKGVKLIKCEACGARRSLEE